VEPDRADHLPTGTRVVEHDRPAEPRLPRRLDREIDDPVLEEVLEVVGHLGRDLRADEMLGCAEVAAREGLHERQ